MNDKQFTFGQAITVSALVGAGAYAAYKYDLLPKKVAAYGALGIIGFSFIATEVSAISDGLPIVLGGAGVVAIAFLLLK